ncbi:hypothetical protein MSSAC_0924 [Methanosarcina siciliae C2J]|uniref:Replication-associated protein ORF2/G2P domain-containing protein n=1 Tax=Methanosarcina siciliae C2J TaxID=1434118 RepID=A0A0E3PK68_9EURY|nr:hypothetical protein MSSAC_0924 [Methanosarcina siciliae C2J]
MTSEQPYSASQVAKYLKEKYNLKESLKRIYKRIYDYLKTEAGKLHFLIGKEDSILWIRANPLKPLTLIQDKQVSDKTELDNGRHCETEPKTYKHSENLEDLRNVNPERYKAMHKLSRCNGFGYMDRETKEFIYTNNIYFEVIQGFGEYISRINTENIEMVHSMDGNPIFSSRVHLPYKTRFTSPERQEENKQAYWATWDYANKRHLKGVFLTLTAPSRAGDLVTVNNQMREAWDKLRDLLNSKLARGLTYIKVNEFQKNGRLHFHLVIFGINWVMPIHLLKKVWVGYGGGKVMNIRAITRTKEGWTWARKPPQEAGGQAPAGYLSDYLEKSMSPCSGALYWAFNIQFWSASRDIKQSPEKHETKGVWARVGVIAKEGKRIFQKGNDKAKAFFSGALLRTSKRSEPKLEDKPTEKENHLTGFRRASALFMQG